MFSKAQSAMFNEPDILGEKECFEDSLEKHLTFPHHRSYAVLLYQRFIPVYPGQNDGRRGPDGGAMPPLFISVLYRSIRVKTMAEEEPDGHLSQPRSLTSSHPRQINSRLLDKSSRGVQNLPSATLSRQRHRKSNGLHLTGCILITIPPGYGSFQWKITAFKWNRLPKLDLFQPPTTALNYVFPSLPPPTFQSCI
ncbi:hypothetical protein CDAR_544531 [Caerostris darwini]|uniref:Maturase K n=1 Tax=Caerostris darwini TaxID=1538125 RepID=A0AAV4QCK5_9ARAC|nr:hypothetical protein CDAR_544531 [Caerostris darwini]